MGECIDIYTLPLLFIKKQIVMNEKTILILENIIDVFKKKNEGQPISDDEINAIVTRFKELVEAPFL